MNNLNGIYIGDKVTWKYNKSKTLGTVIDISSGLVTVQKDNGETYIVNPEALEIVIKVSTK